jgi:ABC-2 type transport system permease protein
MILPIVRTAIRNLTRDRSALLLTFVLPIAFFTIFAMIFGAQRSEGTPKVHVIIADEDHSDASTRLVAALKNESALRVSTAPEPKEKPQKNEKPQALPPYTLATAEKAVREGDAPVALVIPKGFGNAPISFGPQAESNTKIQLLCDSSDPIAPQVLTGLLQKAAMISLPDVMAGVGTKYLDQIAFLTPQQKAKVQQQMDSLHEMVRERDQASQSVGTTDTAAKESDDFGGLIAVDQRDVLGEKKKNPIIAFYAAGIGVMFLLFSASGAGGALLDEAESGAMDRVLSTKVNMSRLLTGKLVFLTLLGTTQLTVMFVWAAFMFKVELWSHLGGFFIMTIATSLASSAVGLLLASASRSRAQLAAISTLVILSMSALGGSMFPRFIMPESLQKIGLITFNAWAIDGFQKVFWREEPITHLWPQVSVLLLAALVLFAIARQFARRWELS